MAWSIQCHSLLPRYLPKYYICNKLDSCSLYMYNIDAYVGGKYRAVVELQGHTFNMLKKTLPVFLSRVMVTGIPARVKFMIENDPCNVYISFHRYYKKVDIRHRDATVSSGVMILFYSAASLGFFHIVYGPEHIRFSGVQVSITISWHHNKTTLYEILSLCKEKPLVTRIPLIKSWYCKAFFVFKPNKPLTKQ